MLRSMYTGISGMKGFQTKLDVVSNNIANVSTYGFKKGRITFQDIMSQTVQGAQGPQVDAGGNMSGGRNPIQVGLGVGTASIDTIDTQGNRQTTNRTLDLALEGDGMFVVANEALPVTGPITTPTPEFNLAEVQFTRAGNFYLDDDGFIVNANGQYLVGQVRKDGNGDAQDFNDPTNTLVLSRLEIPAGAQSFSISANGVVNYVDAGGQAIAAGQIMLAKFSNPGGLEKVGSNNFRMTNNAGVYTQGIDGFNNLQDLVAPGDTGSASIVAGALEMSNVDLAEEFTEMITAQRGFQANTRIITTSDEILQELVNLKR